MFEKGDYVLYGNIRACKILDIRKEKFGETAELYYILKPLGEENSTIYFPVESKKINIRKLLTSSQAEQFIDLLPSLPAEWIENDQERKAQFEEMLQTGNRIDLAKLVKTCYLAKERKEKEGKKLHMADERIMERAEKLLNSELAHIFEIQPKEVPSYIGQRLATQSSH